MRTILASLLLAGLSLTSARSLPAQELYELPEGVVTRWASPENPEGAKGRAATELGGRKGSPTIAIPAGESAILARADGTSGTVRRIWMTFWDRSPRMLRSLRIDMYWDGAETPAVSAPLGDFFGIGLGRTVAFESALFSNPEGRSFNSVVPMPFRTGMRIVLTNESGDDLPELFYDIEYTLGDRHAESALYFHAHWRREPETRLKQDYEILPHLSGRGRFLGTNIGVITNRDEYFNTWWGEGEVKIYLDGDSDLPTLAGTGTEDYVGTAWGQGEYAHLYQGSPIADEGRGLWAFYRYHLPDPVYFTRDVRVTMQQIGYLADHSRGPITRTGRRLFRTAEGWEEMDTSRDGRFERSDDWSSCAYFYLDRPENGLPPLPPVAERVADL